MKKRGVEDKSETGAAASRKLARELVDPRPYAVGSLKKVYEKYPHFGRVLPAMGYSEEQIKDLRGHDPALRLRRRGHRYPHGFEKEDQNRSTYCEGPL